MNYLLGHTQTVTSGSNFTYTLESPAEPEDNNPAVTEGEPEEPDDEEDAEE